MVQFDDANLQVYTPLHKVRGNPFLGRSLGGFSLVSSLKRFMVKRNPFQFSKSKLRAIDLYSGIGGWSLGLEMAGIDVVASYEWWNKANITNQQNNRHIANETDIRQLSLIDLPSDIDIVVGSPPCTQFSFANRGGKGDIEDGLKDIAKFLEIVDFLKPKFWAMENVPRVSGIIENELKQGGRLEKFAHLAPTIRVIDTCEWGVPQRRQRCIAGNFNFDLLYEYRSYIKKHTLGDVVNCLSKSTVIDPLYGIKVKSTDLIDHVIEDYLNPEEERMNREMKTFHPIYNNMAFPDQLNRAARTVTATCTRVSRESIVIASPEVSGKFRRLSVRERACLQGFPIIYQFYGNSHSQKLKMIGNAVPPLFTFYIAQAFQNTSVNDLIKPEEGINLFVPPIIAPPKTVPDNAGDSFPHTRRFRAALPHLRFKSGVRFELANDFLNETPNWSFDFYYGNSKNISSFELDDQLLKSILNIKDLKQSFLLAKSAIAKFQSLTARLTAQKLQSRWSRNDINLVHPYELVDAIGCAAEEVISSLELNLPKSRAEEIIDKLFDGRLTFHGMVKIRKHALSIIAGFIVTSLGNSILHSKRFNKNR
jgi:DNA (cytosine-5)-methyltransferase 1